MASFVKSVKLLHVYLYMANCGPDPVHGGDIPVFYNRSRTKRKFFDAASFLSHSLR